MSVGFLLLVHTALDRAAEVARHLADSGCPVVIHADAKLADAAVLEMARNLSAHDRIRFVAPRWRVDWGTWSMVGATIDAAREMLAAFPNVSHVYLASGACLPLRPLPDLVDYLAARRRTDFVESVTIEDVSWSKGGFDRERFTLRFPFSFQRQRFLFDRWVDLQRRLNLRREVPAPLVPHLGSQWWCLSRETLAAILDDPDRRRWDRYFRRVWIPDESYFQTLARLHSRRIESRSLTLSKFDFQGKPHVFYDDHLQLLRRSDCFFARKIWPRADRLYNSFLSNDPAVTRNAEPNPGKIDRLFAQAADRRVHGRPGLYMQSRFPARDRDNGRTAERYSVFQGLDHVFEGFPDWLGKTTGLRVHGHLYAPGRVEFAGGARVYNGGLCDSAALRDYNPCAFLTNLIWATRGERQVFMYGPADEQYPLGFMAGDPHAQITVVTGAWAIALYRRGAPAEAIRKEAARLQRVEIGQIDTLRAHWAKARIRIWSLAEFLEAPMENLRPVLDEISPRSARRLTEAPVLADLAGFGRFLQTLKNAGMNLHLAGDFPPGEANAPPRPGPARPYLVK